MIFIEMQMLISWGVSGQNIYHSCTDSQTGGNFTHAACCFTNLSYSQIRRFADSQVSMQIQMLRPVFLFRYTTQIDLSGRKPPCHSNSMDKHREEKFGALYHIHIHHDTHILFTLAFSYIFCTHLLTLPH